MLLAKSIMVDEKPAEESPFITVQEDETIDHVLHALLSEDGSFVNVEQTRKFLIALYKDSNRPDMADRYRS